MDKLNQDQKIIYDAVMKAVYGKHGANPTMFYVSGPAGTGKTFLFKAIQHTLGNECQAVSQTGHAASLYIGGNTSHSAFRIPWGLPRGKAKDDGRETPEPWKATSAHFQTLQNLRLIIWDNATMTQSVIIDWVDQMFCKYIGDPDEPFGGKIILFGGDNTQQLGPGFAGNSLLSNPRYEKMQREELTVDMKYVNDDELCDLLSDLRLTMGQKKTKVGIRDEFIYNGDIADFVYPPVLNPLEFQKYAPCVILCRTNAQCLVKNQEILDRLSTPSVTFTSKDHSKRVPEEELHDKNPGRMPPHELVLKRGAIVMLAQRTQALPTGTRLCIEEMDEENGYVTARVVTGAELNKRIVIRPRSMMVIVKKHDRFNRKQLPLVLAFAMTVHKAQGQAYEKVGLWLPEVLGNETKRSLLYGAFSRVRTVEAIKCQIN